MLEQSPDFLATELLSELKEENKRKDDQIKVMHKKDAQKTWAFLVAILVTISLFLVYLYQYDFTSEQSVSGVYALVDSEGNVVASDFSPEELEQLMEVVTNGESEN